MRNVRLIGIAGAVIAGLLAVSAGSARAELRVIESNVPGIARDATFADEATFEVPAGTKIKFLKGGATHEIAGPYKGTLADYQPACGWWAWFRGKCARNTAAVGGTRGAAPVPGATRSAAPVAGGTRSLGQPKQ